MQNTFHFGHKILCDAYVITWIKKKNINFLIV